MAHNRGSINCFLFLFLFLFFFSSYCNYYHCGGGCCAKNIDTLKCLSDFSKGDYLGDYFRGTLGFINLSVCYQDS